MAYIEILDTQLDPDAPITSNLGYQLRNNPEEIAEGGDGATKVKAPALKCNIIGVDSVTSADFTSAEDIAYAWFDVTHVNVDGGGTTGSIVYEYRTSTDGGATKTSWTTVVTGGAGSAPDYACYSNGVTLPSNTDYLEIRADRDGASPGTPEIIKFTALIFGEDAT